MSIYEKLKAAGCQLDNHESDLYVEATEKGFDVYQNGEKIMSYERVIEITNG